jgi:hypothetical protein
MNVTIKSTKTIKCGTALPPAPRSSARNGHYEVTEVEAFIRSVGGKAMTQGTKRRLHKARCEGFPQD